MANLCIRCCRVVKHIPTRILLVLLFALHATCVDYYLVTYKNNTWLAFIGVDVVCLAFFILAFTVSYKQIKHEADQKNTTHTGDEEKTMNNPFCFISWFIFSVVLSVKAAVLFKDVSYLLDENMFFGPNTLKTALALSGVVFLLLLSTMHDARPGSDRRMYIEELTGTVIFDILDGVDSMEILFIKEDRDAFPPGLEDTIIGIACINFILPTVPLLTLSVTKFGQAKMSRNLIMMHKVCLAFAVNLPLLITRMILWHGLNHGISIFSLKNIIVISMICYDFFEHHESEEEKGNKIDKTVKNDKMDGEEYALEDRFNYITP